MEVITTHKATDFDALASLVAASIIYPEAVALLPKNVNPNIKAFLSIHKDLFDLETANDLNLDAVSRLIVVDANRWDRLEGMNGLMGRDDLDIHIWDHHKETGDIVSSWSCVEEVGAATTIFVQRLEEEKRLLLSPMHATLFLAGIYEDTGNLTFPSTTAQDAKAVAFLLEQRSDLNVVNSFLRPTYGPKQKDVLFDMLSHGSRPIIKGFRLAMSRVVTTGHTPGLSVVVHMYRDIMNVDTAFGIFVDEERNRCMVIGRSTDEGLDVSKIMRSMGGGGHPAAASAVLKGVNPEAVEEWILELIQGNQQTSVQISDLMSFPVRNVPPEATMKEVYDILYETGHSGLPIVEDGRLVGVISKRDLSKLKREDQWKVPVKAFMSRQVVCIEPGSSPLKAARLMLKHDVGRLPVMKDGDMIGILTRSDVMTYFYDLLPD